MLCSGPQKPVSLPDKLKGDEDDIMLKLLQSVIPENKVNIYNFIYYFKQIHLYQKKIQSIKCYEKVNSGTLYLLPNCFIFSCNKVIYHEMKDILKYNFYIYFYYKN